jgi:small-conductance mechanosensitive channel
METVEQFLSNIREAVLTPAGTWQIVIIAVALLVSLFLHRRWKAYVRHTLGPKERRGFRRFLVRGSVRIMFPVSMMLIVLAAAGVMSQFAIKTPILHVLVPLLASLAVIRILIYILRRVYGPSPALRAWEGIIGTMVWSVVALHLLGWLPDVLRALDSVAVSWGKTRVSVLSVSKLVLTIALFVVIARWLSRMIEIRALHTDYISASMRIGLVKFSKFMLYTVAVLVALNSVGIDLTTLTVFGGALGVGIGFGFQRIASNFISGFILLFDRSIKPGDVITIGSRFGWVVALHARYIVVRDREGVEALIPNENLITSEVTNWSYSDKHVRVKLPVSVSYRDDPELAMELMEKACEANDRVLNDPAPVARLLKFGDNGIELELRLWLEDPENGIGSVKSDVNLAIWRSFQEHGITIPYPQRDVHMIEKG